MLTPDLTPVFAFIGLIVILMSIAIVFAEGRAQRATILLVILTSLGVGGYLHHTQLTDRLSAANAQTADVVRCLTSTGQICLWETR